MYDYSPKSLMLSSTAAAIVERAEKNDVRCAIFMSYDGSVSDEEAKSEIAATYLTLLLSDRLKNRTNSSINCSIFTAFGF